VLLLLQSAAQIVPPLLAKNIVDQAVIPAVNAPCRRTKPSGGSDCSGVVYLVVLAVGAGIKYGRRC